MNLEDKAREILKTKGIEITCPSCHQKFTAFTDPAVCTHCHKSFTVKFNF
ncbi:DUF2614 family zinc ribbon-containing protein [Lactiplantibacillus plantarum]|nr:DUF2614 family zinc ribbon-containing protein [Lactiplantibacillus plantarum]MDP5372474.1 DUF2614 family zinc ribbon-containing protein [Lactiplantibacillus plantarum]